MTTGMEVERHNIEKAKLSTLKIIAEEIVKLNKNLELFNEAYRVNNNILGYKGDLHKL